MNINYGATVYDSGVYQVGIVARDYSGQCVHWLVRRFQVTPTPVVAEATTARLAIILAIKIGWSHIHLERDCLEVVNDINDPGEVNFRAYGVIISSCRALLSSFTVFHCSFIRCIGNGIAHELADFPIFDCFELEWITLPADLAHLI